MHPVLKRVLLHGGATAVVLACVGLLFSQLAAMWASGSGQTARTDLDPQVGAAIRYRVPLMMAFWGFAFVAAAELLLHRFRRPVAEKSPEPPADDAEKLLNELLAQAEAKMAQEAESRKAQAQGPGAETPERKSEGSGQKPEPGHRSDGGDGARAGPSVL
ncbi:hypothetical protein [Frigoriglobus tundricola]|uniref:Uncharacterized protein n=1 Tax=Frigoriglobus tundricola TaxID=2774151 RepID=A0A6M5Z2P2_9BACT|nr:hypothetical protein [Frigoriglobus tundricola]QJW99462.1 hypothetical protein FTUN_7074 [Frigoriglobus tundricola]